MANFPPPIDQDKITSIEAHREFRIDSLSISPDCCDKRIDILIIVSYQNDTEEYLAIENKVFAKESEDQTSSYSSALAIKAKDSKHRILRYMGILLSPYSCVPKSNDFKPIGYIDLFKILLATKNTVAQGISLKYSNFYLYELASTILKRQLLLNA